MKIKTLNGELQGKFAEWYPGLQHDSESATALPLAA